jgi:DNA-binding response OmpR family regulator
VTPPRGRVLVLDAEPHIARLVALQLGDEYQVTAARDLEAALAELHAVPYDVALVELGVDGRPPIERLHADRARRAGDRAGGGADHRR